MKFISHFIDNTWFGHITGKNWLISLSIERYPIKQLFVKQWMGLAKRNWHIGIFGFQVILNTGLNENDYT